MIDWSRVSCACIAHLSSRSYVGKMGCAPKARITSGGRFHSENCRLIWKLTSGLVGQLAGSEPLDKGCC